MQTFGKEFTASDFDEHGRADVSDALCGQIVTAGMGYGSKKCKIIVDGKTRNGEAMYGRYASWVTVPAMAKKAG